MRCGNSTEIIYKEVIIIGNGPSGIALSYMLSGNLPYVKSANHPDEMLSARLRNSVGKCLAGEDLLALAAGLEGRSTNPVSLLLDSLLHPYADNGLELESLVEFKKTGIEIDHIVIGKGPPGGSWHSMDPHILTLSLGSWMALPSFPFHYRDSGEKRAYACSVAKYYEEYVSTMDLSKNFKNNVLVTKTIMNKPAQKQLACLNEMTTEDKWLEIIDNDSPEQCEIYEKPENNTNTCLITKAINYLLPRASRKVKTNRCSKRPREQFLTHDQSPERKIRELAINERRSLRRDKDRSSSFCCDSKSKFCDSFYSKSYSDDNSSLLNSYFLRNSHSLDFSKSQVPCCGKTDSGACSNCNKNNPEEVNWFVETYDITTGKKIVYSSKYLVLANGASDLPNRLDFSKENKDPSWLVHDLRSLEKKLDYDMEQNVTITDPVLIIGAGLSAADAVIATRGRNIPVCHVFRNKSADLNKQLPENMYPEYHKVHQMMQDGGSTYPLYTSYPEFTLVTVDDKSRTVILESKSREQIKLQVSYAAVLIGSRPDLSFLPSTSSNLGTKKDLPVDCKTNTIDINKLTHLVNGFNNLFAVGPLAGDNFVRFIPGGALAVVSELYKQYNK